MDQLLKSLKGSGLSSTWCAPGEQRSSHRTHFWAEVGLTNREIGKLLHTTEQVVKNHLRSTFDKLGVWSRLELAMYVASHGGKNWLEECERTPVSIQARAAAG